MGPKNKKSDGGAEGESNFEDFVRAKLADITTKLDNVIAGQASLKKKLTEVETKVKKTPKM